jgi:phosphoribosylpyrophosphate synthetase
MGARVIEKLSRLQAETAMEGEIPYLENVDGQFSDSETYARLGQDVSGADVYLFQALFDPYPLEAWTRTTWHS